MSNANHVAVVDQAGTRLSATYLKRARKMVAAGKATWVSEPWSIQLTTKSVAPHKNKAANEDWPWPDTLTQAKGPAGKVIEIPKPPRIFHRGGPDGALRHYRCSPGEFAFLVQTGVIAFINKQWTLTKVPRLFLYKNGAKNPNERNRTVEFPLTRVTYRLAGKT